MDDEKTTRELEWFDLETRMRELIHTQLEPIIHKSREDRETTQQLKNHSKQLENRIKSLETAVLGDQSIETVIENIYKKCAEIEGNRKKDTVKLEQSLMLLNENVQSFHLEVQKFREALKLLDSRDFAREQEIKTTNNNVDTHKLQVLEEIDKLSENFREMNKIYKEVAMKTEEQANIASSKATANSLEMGNYKREIDTVRKDVVDSLSMIKEVRGLKLNIEVYEKEKDKVQEKFIELSDEILKFRDELKERDLYVDKYIPLQTVVLISDYLYSFLDAATKKKLADYETISLKELNLNVLESKTVSTRMQMADKILDSMKHVEERKVEFQTKEIKSPTKVQILAEAREKLRKKTTIKEEVEEEPPGLSKAEVEKIVHSELTVQLDAEIGRLKTELSEKLTGFKKYLKSFNSEASSMHTQFVSELENLTSRMKLNKSDLLLEVGDVKKFYDGLKSEISTIQNTVNSHSNMILGLYECCQIEQALEKQDEEDRHHMAVNLEKEMQNELAGYTVKSPETSSILPSANFSFQKKCLSCGTSNSIFSGYRTSIVYHPSALVYRNKKFERNELMVLKGNLLRKSIENSPFLAALKVEEMQPEKSFEKATEKSDRSTKFSRLGSIDESSQDYNLPLLVSPSMRNRSKNKTKAFRNN